jgi:lipopolysaccharide transport system permease protein
VYSGLFTPIIMSAAIWIFLSSTGVVRLAQTSIPYPLFVVSGVTLWSIFNDCLLMSIGSVNSNKSIITKINFEKEALVTLGFIKLGFNVLIKLSLIVVLLIVFKAQISYSILWFFPLLLISMLMFMSIGIIITPLGVLFGDVMKFVPLTMQMFMYITPVMYMIPKEGIMKQFMELNPLSYIMMNLRNCLTGFPIQNELLPIWVFYFGNRVIFN